MRHDHAYAVFTELSPANKPMQPGMNTRVFTDIDVLVGDAIRLDLDTGVITLAPGTYHISGFSTTIYYTETDPPEMISSRNPACGGYCRVWNKKETDLMDNSKAIVLGSAGTSNGLPSLFETYYSTDEVAEIIVEHQSGSNPEGVYLRVFSMNSKWHAFARIAIRRL